MRPAAKRLIWVPAAAGLLAIASSLVASWATLGPAGLAFAAVVLSRVLATLIFRLGRLPWRRVAFRDCVTAALACAGGSAIAATVCGTLPCPWPARFLAVEAALYPCLLLGLAGVPLLRDLRARPTVPNAVRTLIWGAGSEGRALLERLRRSNPAVEVFGWLDDDPVLAELDLDGLPVLGPIETLPLLVELHGVQSVLVAIPNLAVERRALAEDLATWSGVPLAFSPSPAAASAPSRAEPAMVRPAPAARQ